MKTIGIEVNEAHVDKTALLGAFALTPPIDGDFWMWRVPVAKNQSIVAFRKFGTIGCGFQREKDWNTNLPLSCDATEIYDHIAHNKGCRATRAKCIAAITALQDFALKNEPGFAEKRARMAARAADV
jgi:hypothetical protein